ncbi:response regulator transcription factor [Arcobacter sp. CECT 8985]|uniref:response regulator transcription factor n=1 Tax=Arcobacter sp. CECT 8985 TaxID=1935424 RepID=UPI00100B18AC|nr:response regulator transcription factor [Arcobacter sp. CECT 8985]RXJ87731.1 DNA-binding response regulator [Arcobacter sp. CECT 8985]
MKILLLEDDIMLNNAIKQYLESVNHAIISTRDGKTCLDILEDNKFDLLILDINVPKVNGLAILEELNKNKKVIPTIFISALIDIEDISKAFDMGCYDYLKKPFHLKELHLRINRLLQNKVVPLQHKRLSRNYSFDLETTTLYFNNEPHILPKRQLLIISLLAKNRSLVVNYDMFRTYAYEDDNVDIATIRAEVNRVKKVLKEDFIINVRGVGYMVERPN